MKDLENHLSSLNPFKFAMVKMSAVFEVDRVL